MSIQAMTFHESYGPLPKRLLTLYRRVNVTPAEHDDILRQFGHEYGDTDIPWDEVYDFTVAMSADGIYRGGKFF